MPPKKVTGRRKGYKRTATRYRKYVGRRRQALVPRSLTYNVHYFKRTVGGTQDVYNCLADGTVIKRDGVNNYFKFCTNAPSQGTKVFGALVYQFSLESLPSITELTSLFDAYRINKVVVKITPSATMVSSNNVSSTSPVYSSVNPLLHWVLDHDDIALPSLNEGGLNILRQYPSYKWRRLIAGRPISIVVKPRTATSSNQSTGIGITLNHKKMGAWFDCANDNIKFFGLKMLLTGIQPTQEIIDFQLPFDIQTTYYLSFKGVR